MSKVINLYTRWAQLLPMFLFDPPWNISENLSIFDVSRGIKRENWEGMG